MKCHKHKVVYHLSMERTCGTSANKAFFDRKIEDFILRILKRKQSTWSTFFSSASSNEKHFLLST